MLVQLWRRMRTQSPSFWEKEFEVTSEDIEHIYTFFLEQERPASLDELATQLVERRYREERERLERELERGQIYRPEESYQVGQTLVFSAFDYALGEVVSIRDGYNPRHDAFKVVGVQIEDEEDVREFASEYAEPHPLNLSELPEEQDAGELSAEELYDRYGPSVKGELATALEVDPELVSADGLWFLKSLLPEVHIGHLNIAEAMITMEQRPLTADELMDELDLPGETSLSARRFALEQALAEDERFDELLMPGGRQWFLYSLEPDAVVETPLRLEPAYLPQPEELLLGELVEFVREIGDEWDARPDRKVSEAEQVFFILNYPHKQEGTFPLTKKIRQLLPDQGGERFQMTLEAEEESEISGWILRNRLYGWGLGDWYQEQEVPVGATVTVAATDDPWTLQVAVARQRRTGEWVKEAMVEEGELGFSMHRRALAARYDRNLVIEAQDPAALDTLMHELEEDNIPLLDLLLMIVPELLKLSSQGTFHAKTLYAAVNLVRRSGAVPIFAALTKYACFDPMGAGNWTFDPDLKDVIYGTADEMRDRPFSKAGDLVRDVVVSY
jgi:hypothetical protein